MKKIYLLSAFILLFISSDLFSMAAPATRLIGAGDFTNCGPGNYYDTGDIGGDYSISENFTETYCSNVGGDCIQFVFTLFNTESCCDDLSIYDGPTIGSPLIGTFAGTALPNGGTITSTSGCLTFVWSSDGSVIRPGWEAAFSCVPCPVPTCSDGIQNQGETGTDCGGPCPACSLNHNTGDGNWSTCSGNLFDSGGNGGDYSNSELITETYCSDAGDCISFNFSSFATESCCDDLTIYDGPTTGSPVIGVYQGTNSPGTVQSSSGCLTFVWDSDGSVTEAGWQASASCSPCPTCTDGILNGQEVGIDCGGPTCPACPCSSLPVSNDEACCATSVTVNPDNLCGSTTAGTVAGATASFNGSTCGGTDDDDVWFSFVATNTSHYVDILNAAGSTTDMYHAVYGGTCSATGASLICNDGNSSTVTGLTIGNTYFIRVYTWTATGGQTSTFDVCVGTPPPPPPNDDCGGAISATVNASGCTSIVTSSVASATPSSQNATSCAGTEDDDVWFSFVAPANGAVGIALQNISGSTTDLYHSVWEGTCPALTLVAGTCSDPNTSTPTALTPGNTYYLRVYSYTSTAGQTTTFDLCLTEVGACGNAANNDFCSDPGTLTQGTGTWNNTTTGSYTSDTPGNISIFCGSIENNSWYVFTAQSTTESFVFSGVGGAACGSGIQAEVYDVTTNSSGCCTAFTSVSNCFNPASQVGGTVTATGLTVGQDYYLMIDGNAGAGCDFSVAGWDVSLPIELIKFEGYNFKGGNKLKWSTATEINNDYFIVQKSSDAKSFENIGIVDGSGNSNTLKEYSFIDDSPRTNEVAFYRLRQIDFDGNYSHSKILIIESKENLDIKIYPNPTSDNFSFDISESDNETYTVVYTNVMGAIHREQINISEGSNTYEVNDFTDLAKGIYFVQLINGNNEVVKSQKVIKK
ncbi:MAG: T9SS type A sorting domain-containing protein [Vicingaceae bacterium]|nr:T9SS type A sorting domain-containing protein [Vicingaceae bacterium]